MKVPTVFSANSSLKLGTVHLSILMMRLYGTVRSVKSFSYMRLRTFIYD